MTSDLIIHKILPREFYGAERSWRCTQTCGAFENTRRFADLWDSTVTMHPPPPKKKKKKKKEEKKEKELSFFYTFQKLKKRHDTGFYYIHSEIIADPCNLIGSNGAIYSQKAPFSSKLHLSPTQWNWKTTQFCKFLKTSSLLDKKSISTD